MTCNKATILCNIGLLLVVFGAMLFAIDGAAKFYIQAKSWPDVDGTVVAIGYGSYCDSQQLSVEYTPDERYGTYATEACWMAHNYNVGDEYMLKYDPADPSNAHPKEAVEEGRTWVICLGVAIGVGVLMIGGSMYLSWMESQKLAAVEDEPDIHTLTMILLMNKNDSQANVHIVTSVLISVMDERETILVEVQRARPDLFDDMKYAFDADASNQRERNEKLVRIWVLFKEMESPSLGSFTELMEGVDEMATKKINDEMELEECEI